MNISLTTLICGILLSPIVQAQSFPSSEERRSGSVAFGEKIKLNVEIADTASLRKIGLMYRPRLAENHGMLFVYPDQAVRGVWMKNTLIPLDVLFLSDDGKVVSMLRGLMPCEKAPCPISVSSAKARYMLELNAGFIDTHRIRTGQDAIIDYEQAPESDSIPLN